MFDGVDFGGPKSNHQTFNFISMPTIPAIQCIDILYDIMAIDVMLVM